MKRAGAALAGLLALAFVFWFLSPSPTGEVSRAPEPTPAPVRSVPVAAPMPGVEPVEPVPPLEDNRPDTAIPIGAEFGIIDDPNDIDRQVEEAAVDAMLALPPRMTKLFGEWDGFMLVPERVGRIEDLLMRPVDRATLLKVQQSQAAQSEAASMAVGEYRLGRLTAEQAEQQLEASRLGFRKEAMDSLGLTDAQFDEVFGLGTL